MAKRSRIEKIEDTLTDLAELRKRDLDPKTRASVEKSNRELQLAYLREVSPAGARAWEASAGHRL